MFADLRCLNYIASEKASWLSSEALQLPFNGRLFSTRVKEKRESLGLSVRRLVKITKVSVAVIYRLESNTMIPSMALCYKLAKVLKLKPVDFIDTTSY